MAAADVLAGFAEGVFVYGEADDALTRCILIVISVRVQSISFLDGVDSLTRDNLLLDKLDLQRCHAKLKVEQSLVPVVRNCVIKAYSLNDDREVLSPLVAGRRIVAELAKVNELAILVLRCLVELALPGGYKARIVRIDLREANHKGCLRSLIHFCTLLHFLVEDGRALGRLELEVEAKRDDLGLGRMTQLQRHLIENEIVLDTRDIHRFCALGGVVADFVAHLPGVGLGTRAPLDAQTLVTVHGGKLLV